LVNQKPTHIAVAFDPKGGTFRHDFFPEYKAGREETPEDIKIAFPYIRSIVEAFNIPIVEVPNYEADDTIGTLSKQAEKEGYTVYMVTPDKDYAQLVSENIFMYKPSRQGNGVDIWGEKEILEKWDIDDVLKVIDVLGLQGDKVDNIPGVPGIGPKTAVKLLKQFGTLEGILAGTEELKGKQKENLENFAEQARLSYRLATIDLNVPIQFDAKKYVLEPFDKPKLEEIFKDLEFRSLASAQISETKKKYSIAKKDISSLEHDYQLIDTPAKRKEVIAKLEKQKFFSFDTETTHIDANIAELVGLVFSYEEGIAYYIPIPEDQAEAKSICAEFKGVLEDPKIELVGQNIKYDALIMKWYDVELSGNFFDTMIAHYLCEPDLRHKLDYLAESYLDYKMVPITDIIGKAGKNQLTMRDVEIEKAKEYAGEDADMTMRLKAPFMEMMKENEILDLYHTMEAPLIKVLTDIEFEGVRINKEFLNDYSVKLGDMIADIKKEIYSDAGVEFNIGSPKQVGQVLFERLEIPYRWRKTASGQYSTDVEKLTELAANNEIVDKILTYRKYSKLKSTYVDALPLMINPKTNRIHSNFNHYPRK